jgi:glycosyltransferase involved in cell wall biosynthesis
MGNSKEKPMTVLLRTECGSAKNPDEKRLGPPQVSILCVTYKQESFVLDAVRGLLQQTGFPLDILILDDASPDATAHIIAAELARHPHRTDIRFIRNERNLGARANILKGISLAQGEFIIPTCGDDIMLPTMVEKMVKVWLDEKVSLITVNAIYIDQNSAELGRFFRRPDEPYDETFETLARDGGNALCFGAGLGFERRLFDEAGWPRGYPTVLDIMLPFSAYLSNGARFILEPLLKYRVNPQNTSLSLAAESSAGIEKLMIESEIFCRHLEQSFLMEAELQRLKEKDPARFSEIARRIQPLVAVQTSEMARKLVRARIELNRLGVTRPIGSNVKPAARD